MDFSPSNSKASEGKCRTGELRWEDKLVTRKDAVGVQELVT